MAIRREELHTGAPGRVLRFPTERAAARFRRQKVVEGRRRLALLVAAATVIVGVAFGAAMGPTGVTSRADAPATIVLQPGDTLWGVAIDFADSSVDPRAYVDELQDLNDIEGAPRAGMQVTLPR